MVELTILARKTVPSTSTIGWDSSDSPQRVTVTIAQAVNTWQLRLHPLVLLPHQATSTRTGAVVLNVNLLHGKPATLSMLEMTTRDAFATNLAEVPQIVKRKSRFSPSQRKTNLKFFSEYEILT